MTRDADGIRGLPELRALGDRSQETIRVRLGPLRRVPGKDWYPELQRAMRPGGIAHVVAPDATGGELSRLREEARHYFDVEAMPDGFLARRRPTTENIAHFEQLAPEYWAEIPAHVQDHFLGKKLQAIEEFVGPVASKWGLDLGCGVGRYAIEMRRRFDAKVVAIDPTQAALREARAASAGSGLFVAADALRLPFRDVTFDYGYTINVIHHLKRGEQERALGEIRRVLKPGAVLVVHEMNIRNPLFAWYLRRVYPKVRPIDRGDEEFIHPDEWPLGSGWDVVGRRYMTFVPDFVPRPVMPALRALERGLEKGRAAPYSAHYAVALRRR